MVVDPITIALIVAALIFAFVHGTNTGGSLLATGIMIRSITPLLGLIIMALGVGLAPFIVGTAVATTLAGELVDWDAEDGRTGMLASVLVTIAVIFVLGKMRVPSSMTLALIGAIAGYAFASGGEVRWHTVIKVLIMMAVAPVIGGVFAALIRRVVAPILPRADVGRSIRRAHIAAFSLLSFAYGANDAQKMIAVMAVAFSSLTVRDGEVSVSAIWWQVLACSFLFMAGSAFGVAGMSKTISTGVLPARPLDMVTTEASTAGAMLISTTVGAPVGLAQTLSGALVGSGVAQGVRRVRWREVSRIVAAWGATLPTTFAAAALVGLVVGQR